MEYIPISSVKDYTYCPKSAWYLLLTGQVRENVDMVEGALLHERADSSVRTVIGDLVQTRTVYLYSDTYGLTGVADLIEQNTQETYPVEYKKGKDGDWEHHQVQLCAQAFCLEEMLTLCKPIRRGFIYYVASGKRREIRLNRKLRTTAIRAIDAVRKLLDLSYAPRIRYGRKCPKCSWYPICLPKEVELMNKHKRWW